MSMPIIKQKQLKNGWIKVTEGNLPIISLPGNRRLRIRKNGRGKAIVAAITNQFIDIIHLDPPIIINQGDTYKLEQWRKRPCLGVLSAIKSMTEAEG